MVVMKTPRKNPTASPPEPEIPVLGVKLIKRGDVIYVLGRLDEVADFSPLTCLPGTLRISLAGLQSINSIGLRRWITFIHEIGMRRMELLDCSVPFVEAANMIPEVISPTGNVQRVVSIMLPFSCMKCGCATERSIAIRDAWRPLVSCKCGGPCATEIDLDDHLFFLSA